MTILHLTDTFLPEHLGGKEIYAYTFANELKQLGHRNVVLTHGNVTATEVRQYKGIEHVVLPPYQVANPYLNRYDHLVTLDDTFGKYLDELQPDIVHFHDQNGGASLSHLKVVKAKGIKAVLTFHTPGQICPQRALLQNGTTLCNGYLAPARCTRCQLQALGIPKTVAMLASLAEWTATTTPTHKITKLAAQRAMTRRFIESYREFMQLVDAIVVFNPWGKACFEENGIDATKISVIPTGGRPSLAEHALTQPAEKLPLKIAYIGRCENIKGIDVLIDAIRHLPTDAPVKVSFYSNSWEQTGYGRQQLQKIKSDPRFAEPIKIDNEAVPQHLMQHHVCCIPSIWPETGPLTLFDAFACKLPVIGSNRGGIADKIVQGENGWLFEAGNVKELSKLIENLIRNHEMVQQARNNIGHNRTMRDVAEDTNTFYQAILKK